MRFFWNQFLNGHTHRNDCSYKNYIKSYNSKEERAAQTLSDWLEIEEKRGYNRGWAFRRFELRNQKRKTYKIP
jgi:hypothetical protein